MDKSLNKEFSIGDFMKLTIIKNDFDSLGTVLEMKFSELIKTKHILVMSFYNENKEHISQKDLKLSSNYKNILFDNILIISNLKSFDKNNFEYKLKFMNKNIYYMKFYIQTNHKENEYSISQIFNLNQMKIIPKEEAKNLLLGSTNSANKNNDSEKKKEKDDKQNSNMNMILSELDTINQTLIEKQNKLDKKENSLKEREIAITKQKQIIEQKIVQFKEEILLFRDKCYGECQNEVNAKIQQISKKISVTEKNIMNKYRIIKEKIANNSKQASVNSNIVNLISSEKKEKIANLEIKIKFLEDSLNKLKEKNNEYETKIKNYSTNEEKLNKNIKKLKDDLVLANSQINNFKKNFETKSNTEQFKSLNNNINNLSNISYADNESIISSSIVSKVTNKKKSNLISFDLDQHQKEIISKYFAYNYILNYNYFPFDNNNILNDKDVLSSALLLMHLSTNPIALYNKYDIGHIIILYKLIFMNDDLNSYKIAIKECLNELFIKIPDFKNNINLYITNNKNQKNNDFSSIIDMSFVCLPSANENINEINISDVIFNRSLMFNNFITKNNISSNVQKEKKNKIKKLTIISNLIISILFCDNFQEMTSIIKQILICFSNNNKDEEIINFLFKIKLSKILLLVIEKINNNEKYSNKTLINSNSIKELFGIIMQWILIMISFANIKKNITFDIEKELGGFLWQKIFVEFLRKNIKDFVENDLNEELFMKTIIFLSNICICCEGLRLKVSELFKKEIQQMKNEIKNKRNIVDNKSKILLEKNVTILERIILNNKT